MATFEQLQLEIVENLEAALETSAQVAWEFPKNYPQKTALPAVYVGIGGISLEENPGGGIGTLNIRFVLYLPPQKAAEFQPFIHQIYQVMSKGKWGLFHFSCEELVYDRTSGMLLSQAKAALYGRFDTKTGAFFPLPRPIGETVGGEVSGSLSVRINAFELPMVQSFKGKIVKESRTVEAFGQSEPVAVVSGAVCYRLELCWAASELDEALRDLSGFTVSVTDAFGEERYEKCQWISRGRTLQKDGRIFQTALVEAASFRYLPQPKE